MNVYIKIIDNDTLMLTDDWLSDYIRLTGDRERPWYFLDGQMLPLTSLLRDAVDQLARVRIDSISWVIEA